MSRFVVVALALAALVFESSASAQVQSYGTNDNGYFNNILPPGENGFDNALQLAQYEANKTYPPHNNDQLQMYSNLTTAAPNIQESQLGQFYKDATFGVPPGRVAGSESPEAGVTIVRDASFGLPHIYGDTRAATTIFGSGTESRLRPGPATEGGVWLAYSDVRVSEGGSVQFLAAGFTDPAHCDLPRAGTVAIPNSSSCNLAEQPEAGTPLRPSRPRAGEGPVHVLA